MKCFDKLTSWYFSRGALPYWSVLFLDYIITVVCGLAAFAVDHGSEATFTHLLPVTLTLCIYSLFYFIGFRLFHTYAGVLRFSSFADLWRLGFAVLTGLVPGIILCIFLPADAMPAAVMPRDLLFGGLLSIAVMWTTRIWVKMLYDESLTRNRHSRAFIYGVADGGIALAKSLSANGRSPYILTGFATDSDKMLGRHVFGVRVYRANKSLPKTMKSLNASTLLVAAGKSDDLRRNHDLVNALINAGIRIMMFPEAYSLNDSQDDAADVSALREVNVEDLLPRDKIEVDMAAIGEQLKGRRILITGAAGSIGSEIARQIASFGPAELILVDQAETPLHDLHLTMTRRWPAISAPAIVADISHMHRMEAIFRKHKPQYVFHAAAYKHVPMMEDNPSESIANNVEGTRIVADLAVKYGTQKFVLVSTDKAVNPTNVMGCSKRICEIYVQALDKAIKDGKVEGVTRFVTTRFGNVLGSNGSVIPLFQEQIKAGGPVTVTHPDIIRFFMLIPEACKLVLEAGTMGNGGEIFVFDMGAPVKIADLARRMISMSGAKNVEIRFTGLRDGEKLYEEVLNDDEITLPTFHPKIKIAKVREYDINDARERIGRLVELSHHADDMAIVGAMKEIVPEYQSRHSRFEALDKKD